MGLSHSLSSYLWYQVPAKEYKILVLGDETQVFPLITQLQRLTGATFVQENLFLRESEAARALNRDVYFQRRHRLRTNPITIMQTQESPMGLPEVAITLPPQTSEALPPLSTYHAYIMCVPWNTSDTEYLDKLYDLSAGLDFLGLQGLKVLTGAPRVDYEDSQVVLIMRHLVTNWCFPFVEGGPDDHLVKIASQMQIIACHNKLGKGTRRSQVE